MMRRQLLPSLIMLAIFTVITGIAYPLVVTGIGQVAFGDKADGSLIERNGVVVGSELIGQPFGEARYFHPRPSAAAYVPGAHGGGVYSFGSNYGPTNDALLLGVDDPETTGVDESTTNGIDDLVRAYREENGLSDDVRVPVDAVTSSASGLDPHISVANARIQARRVATERNLDLGRVLQLVDDNTDGRALAFLGEPGVNVLMLNLALDDLG